MFPFYSKHKGSLLSLYGLAVKMKGDEYYLQISAAILSAKVIMLYLMILLAMISITLNHFVVI